MWTSCSRCRQSRRPCRPSAASGVRLEVTTSTHPALGEPGAAADRAALAPGFRTPSCRRSGDLHIRTRHAAPGHVAPSPARDLRRGGGRAAARRRAGGQAGRRRGRGSTCRRRCRRGRRRLDRSRLGRDRPLRRRHVRPSVVAERTAGEQGDRDDRRNDKQSDHCVDRSPATTPPRLMTALILGGSHRQSMAQATTSRRTRRAPCRSRPQPWRKPSRKPWRAAVRAATSPATATETAATPSAWRTSRPWPGGTP